MSKLIETPETVVDDSSFAIAFAQVQPELEALPKAELAVINLEIPDAVTRVLGKLPQLAGLRDAAAQLPDFDVTVFDRLPKYTRALAHAYTCHRMAGRRTASSKALAERAAQLGELLAVDARALANRGLLDAHALRSLKRGGGYRGVASDLLLLTELFLQHWDAVAGRTAVTRAELETAERLAAELMVSLGRRHRVLEQFAHAADARVRAFTLFVRTYDEVQRAVAFLRWRHGDQDAFAPSLYAGRRRRPARRSAAG